MKFERTYYLALIAMILFFAYLSVNVVLDMGFLMIQESVEEEQTGMGKELLGVILEGYDKASLDILPR